MGASAHALDAAGASSRRETVCRFLRRRPHLIDPTTGEEIAVELFVGVLGASGLIYAEATHRQDLPAWIGAHIRMLEYFQGSAAVWGPDQLKSGVTTASRYEPTSTAPTPTWRVTTAPW